VTERHSIWSQQGPVYNSQIIAPFSAITERQLIHCSSVDKESAYFLRFSKLQLCY